MEKQPAVPSDRPAGVDRTSGGSPGDRPTGVSDQTSPDDRREQPQVPAVEHASRRPARSLAERLNTWVPMVTAVAALILSFVTWAQSQRTPEVTMNLPSIIRIGAESAPSFDVYLQPSFSVPRSYNSTARISSVRLELSRDGDAEDTPDFYWHDSGGFGEYVEGGFGWTYAADPAPFIVGAEEPQRPTIRFSSLERRISPGRWTATITATRGTGQEALVEHFCILVSDNDMRDYEPLDPSWIIDFRNDIPNSPTDCYWRPDDW
jgi:hypothetical protein